VNTNGDGVPQKTLLAAGQTASIFEAAEVHLFLCKNTEKEIAAEKLVDRVVFKVSSGTDGQTWTAGPTRTENYTPFEMSSTDQFGGASLKQIEVDLTSYGGQTLKKTVQLDLRSSGGKRWRFRRHLQAVCSNQNALQEPTPDPWMDLSVLKRETCLSAQDPNSNYATTTMRRAALHSDVANHAYQNSNYSPYMGQQHEEISRTLQAASVVHMTSSNGGELGKANLPGKTRQALKQLNKQVNKIYQNYEKVQNKVIDELNKNGGKNGNGVTIGLNAAGNGVQQLGSSFRSAEKGATSTRRLKTTTYVPSFNVAGYSMNTIQNAIQSRTGGNKAKYADLLTQPNTKTGAQYSLIYQPTMNQLLEKMAGLQSMGITFRASIQQTPCSAITDPTLLAASKGDGSGTTEGIECCEGSLLNKAKNGCGSTLASPNGHRKRSANGQNDGGLYSARKVMLQNLYTQYRCKEACVIQDTKTANLGYPLTKTSEGTCLTWDSGRAGCTPDKSRLAPLTAAHVFRPTTMSLQKPPANSKLVSPVPVQAPN